MTGVFKYAEGTEPKPNVASDSEAAEEAAKEREDSKQPAPESAGTNAYEEGDSEGGDGLTGGITTSYGS